MNLKVIGPMRDCNGCIECCLVIGVEELGKPYYKECQHQRASSCKIYGKHPDSCKHYDCFWRLGEIPEDMYPKTCGYVIEMNRDTAMPGGFHLQAYETRPTTKAEFLRLIRVLEDIRGDMMVKYYTFGIPIPVTYPVAERYGDVELGNRDPEGKNILFKRTGIPWLIVCVGEVP
jgi:hypothetical protein